MNKTFENFFNAQMKIHSINTAIPSPQKSRLFYRINQDKLIKYHHENQLRNSNQNPTIDENKIIYRKTIGTQTTSNKEYNLSPTNSIHSLSNTSSSVESSNLSDESTKKIVRASLHRRVYIREMLGDDRSEINDDENKR